MAEISGVQHLRRRASSVLLNTFVGSTGEICADMTYLRTSLADGVTLGGWFSAKGNSIAFPATVGGLTYIATGSNGVIYVFTQNAGRVTLPSALSYPAGQKLTITDATGSAGVNNVTIATASASEKLIGNNLGTITNSTSMTIATNGLGFQLTPMSTVPGWAFWFA